MVSLNIIVFPLLFLDENLWFTFKLFLLRTASEMSSAIYFCPGLLNLYQRFFCFVLFSCLFSPEGNWQQQEQAHAEGAFVARRWKHKWPACRSSKASSSMKKPCWRQTAGTARPFPPNLWLVTFNGISSQAFELLSNAGVWPAFMVTYYWFQPTSIQSVNVCLCLLDRCQAQSKTQLSEFPGMGSLDPALGKIAFFYLFSLDFDQEKSWCRCIIPKARPPFWLFF